MLYYLLLTFNHLLQKLLRIITFICQIIEEDIIVAQ